MRTVRRTFTFALLVLGLLPAVASAGIWAPVPSGTAEEISAVDYHANGTIRFATTSGKIFKGTASGGFAQEASFPGRQFFDIEQSPNGNLALATADTGYLYRFNGTTWTQVNLANKTFNHGSSGPCPFSPSGPYPAANVADNLLAVAWGSDNIAWVIGAGRGVVLKSTDQGSNFQDVSRQADGTCRLKADVTDVAPVPGSVNDVYFVDDDFATIWRTSDGLASAAQQRAETVNCSGVIMRLAVDPAAANRVTAAGRCEGTLHWGFSSDGGTTKNYTKSGGSRIRDLAGEAGVFIAVGDAGKIEQTFDGENVFAQPADGDLSTKDWRSVDFADGGRAVVAGVTGALAVTTEANKMPDVVAPTVALAGPDTAVAGTPVSFTGQAGDTGGSGVDPNGFTWTGTGLTPTSGATATFTFPAPGSYTISVRARDLAGNVSEVATRTITVDRPAAILPSGTKPPLIGGVARSKGGFVTLRVKGRYGVPPGLTAAQACSGTVIITVKKGKRLLTARTTRLSKTCGYAKKIRIRRSKVGKARRLKLTVRFTGNRNLAPAARNYTVKVKR